jgi:putative transposase
MDLMTNTTFRIIVELQPSTNHEPGIYRVILNEPRFNMMAAVLIHPERERNKDHRGGRKKKEETMLRRPRKKLPMPLVGKLVWMDSADVQGLIEKKLLLHIAVERRALPKLGAKAIEEFDLRRQAMAGFLDIKNLHESLAIHKGMGALVAQAMQATGVSRSYVYKQWSTLCRYGLVEQSLLPCRDRSGAPGVSRPCDGSVNGKPARRKPGRKPLKVRIAKAFGVVLQDGQPAISSAWVAAINAADKQIPAPKPSWPKRIDQILRSSFCGKAKEHDGSIIYVPPERGTYPTAAQVKRVLANGKTQLERLLETTTKRHFNSNLRGLVARNWKGVAGPGHTWAIDSTIGDIYLRSSVNRAWIVGRPVVFTSA